MALLLVVLTTTVALSWLLFLGRGRNTLGDHQCDPDNQWRLSLFFAADDFLPLSYAQPDTPWGSNTTGSSISPRGYCFECLHPWHPHLPPAPPTNANLSPGSEESGAGSQGLPPTSPPDWPQQGLEGGSGLGALTSQGDSSAAGSGGAAPVPIRWEPLPLASPGIQFHAQPVAEPAFLSSHLESGVFSPGFPPLLPTDWPLPGPQALWEGGTGFAPLIPQMDTAIRWHCVPMPPADTLPLSWPDVGALGGASAQASPVLVSFFPSAFPPTPPVQTLTRAARPPPLQLPPPGTVFSPPCAPQRPEPAQGQGPYFSYPSPFVLLKFMNQPGPESQVPAQAQAQAQAQAPSTEAPQKPPDARPKDRRGGDRQALSLTGSKPGKDAKQATMERIVGEIAFQLDRRILSSIFPDRVRLYGFTVSNIPEKIAQGGNDPMAPLSEEQRKGMMERYADIMNKLKPLGYDPNIHPAFTEYIVNTYGILRERPDTTGAEGDTFNNPEYLQSVVNTVVPAEKHGDCCILLTCLSHLSQADGKPLFIW